MYLGLDHARPLVPQVLQGGGDVDLLGACNRHTPGSDRRSARRCASPAARASGLSGRMTVTVIPRPPGREGHFGFTQEHRARRLSFVLAQESWAEACYQRHIHTPTASHGQDRLGLCSALSGGILRLLYFFGCDTCKICVP